MDDKRITYSAVEVNRTMSITLMGKNEVLYFGDEERHAADF
jgi:hypothetical protein